MSRLARSLITTVITLTFALVALLPMAQPTSGAPFTISTWRKVAMGPDMGCAIADYDGGALFCWGDLPTGREKPIDVGRGGVVRQAGHRGLVTLRQRQPKDLGGDFGVVTEDLIEIAEAEEQNGAFRKFLAEFTVLPLHRGFFLHAKERKPPEALRKCGLPAPA